MPFVRAGTLTVHYDVAGVDDAPPIVFANSLGTTMHLWDAQVAALAPHRRIIRYDMRGHGLTALAPPGEGYGMERLADDLAALLTSLDVQRATVIGLSIGGMVAQRFAAVYPERVDALVLCATGSRLGTAEKWNARIATVERDGIAAVSDGILQGWFTPPTHAAHPELIDGFRAMLERTPVRGYAGCSAAVRDADLRADDARIQAPTLVIAGSEDPTAPPSVGEELRAAIRGAQLAIVQGAAHMVCAERPDETTSLIEGFIGATSARGSIA